MLDMLARITWRREQADLARGLARQLPCPGTGAEGMLS